MPLVDESFDRALDEMILETPVQERGPVRRGRAPRPSSTPYPTSTSRGSAPPGGRAGHSNAKLVEEVKDWQRSSIRNAAAWQTFCDEQGDGSYDPAKYDQEFLEQALAELQGSGDGGVRASGGDGGPLTDKLKEWQRSSRSNTQAWRQYCIENGDGSFDPAWYDSSFLKAAFADLGIGLRSGIGQRSGKGRAKGGSQALVPWIQSRAKGKAKGSGAGVWGSRKGSGKGSGKGKGGFKGGGSAGGVLTDEVKAWQRSSIRNSEAWRRYCEQNGDGSYDPGSYTGSFLKAFLEDVVEGGAPRGRAGSAIPKSGGVGGTLTEQVKEIQRGDKANTEAWREFCDEFGDGVYDPSKHEASLLKKFLRSFS